MCVYLCWAHGRRVSGEEGSRCEDRASQRVSTVGGVHGSWSTLRHIHTQSGSFDRGLLFQRVVRIVVVIGGVVVGAVMVVTMVTLGVGTLLGLVEAMAIAVRGPAHSSSGEGGGVVTVVGPTVRHLNTADMHSRTWCALIKGHGIYYGVY